MHPGAQRPWLSCAAVGAEVGVALVRASEQLEDSIAAFDARIEGALSPFHDIVERLKEVPGLGATATETVIAEIGTNMSPFPTAGHLLSWAGFVPRLDERA